jgi:preprotein translocase subunit SecE
VARNRKRAKERRARRPQPVPSTRRERDLDEAPDPIEHAAPDVELAEAQLALGRPDLASDGEPEFDQAEVEAAEMQAEAADLGLDEADVEAAPDEEEYYAEDDGDEASGAATLVAPGGPTPAHPERARAGSRLINFLQGSWRELQRVQWPDRQQVFQATGVVIGFVIIAGVFLGVADWAAGKVMNYVLTGHFH